VGALYEHKKRGPAAVVLRLTAASVNLQPVAPQNSVSQQSALAKCALIGNPQGSGLDALRSVLQPCPKFDLSK
jgi:hypothetical protein